MNLCVVLLFLAVSFSRASVVALQVEDEFPKLVTSKLLDLFGAAGFNVSLVPGSDVPVTGSYDWLIAVGSTAVNSCRGGGGVEWFSLTAVGSNKLFVCGGSALSGLVIGAFEALTQLGWSFFHPLHPVPPSELQLGPSFRNGSVQVTAALAVLCCC